jgi:hypothetical protein
MPVTVRFSNSVLLEHRQHDRQMTAPQRMLEVLLAIAAMVLPYHWRRTAAAARRGPVARLRPTLCDGTPSLVIAFASPRPPALIARSVSITIVTLEV